MQSCTRRTLPLDLPNGACDKEFAILGEVETHGGKTIYLFVHVGALTVPYFFPEIGAYSFFQRTTLRIGAFK